METQLETILIERQERFNREPADSSRSELAEVYLFIANQLFGAFVHSAEPREVELCLEWYERAFELNAEELMPFEFIDAYQQASIVHQINGNHELARSLVDKAGAIQEHVARDHPLYATGIRILHNRSGILTNIGHMFSEPDFLTKRMELGWIPRIKPVLLAERNNVVNPTALDYWRQHVCTITDPRLIARIQPCVRPLELNTCWAKTPSGRTVFSLDAAIVTQTEWERIGRGPLLTLKQEHRARGEAALEELGLPKGAWFVALHVRDETYRAREERDEHGKPTVRRDTIRDADIETYVRAIEMITSVGGWVIRMGDKTMKPMPTMKQTIDYPFTPAKSDWLDVYLGAACRFFIGSASGPLSIAQSFGVPTVGTNIIPINSHPSGTKEVYIPKLLRRKESGELLPFMEYCRSPYVYLYHTKLYERLGVEVVPNSDEDLAEIVVEMLERITGQATYSAEDELLQERYRRCVKQHIPEGLQCRVGRSFLRRYKHLLPT